MGGAGVRRVAPLRQHRTGTALSGGARRRRHARRLRNDPPAREFAESHYSGPRSARAQALSGGGTATGGNRGSTRRRAGDVRTTPSGKPFITSDNYKREHIPSMSITKELASWIVANRPEQIPANVRYEARRAILNYVGCALGGSREPAVDIALTALAPYFGKPIAGVLGRTERMDPLHASLINGISSHVLDFDDTTPSNYIHPTSPVASA